jgi:hypothetical protein
MLRKYYVPETDPASVIVPQVFARFVVSGGTTVIVVAEFAETVRPSGTSSQIV